MKFIAPNEENEQGLGSPATVVCHQDISKSSTRSSPGRIMENFPLNATYDTYPDVKRIKSKLEERMQGWHDFLQQSNPMVSPQSFAKLAYQEGLTRINLEIETQEKERQEYLDHIDNLMLQRSAAAKGLLAEFRQRQKELDDIRLTKILEEQKRLQEEQIQKQKKEAEASRDTAHPNQLVDNGNLENSKPIEVKKILDSGNQQPDPQNDAQEVGKIDMIQSEDYSLSQAISQTSNDPIDMYSSREISERVLFYKELIKTLETSLEPFLNAPETKTLRLNIRMRIQRRITQIAATRQQVVLISKDLNGIFNEVASTPPAKKYALWITAQKFVEQGETQVHVHQKSAFAIAATALLVCDQQPELLTIFLACLVQKCPYVAPYYLKRESSTSESEYRLNLGFFQKPDGTFESEESYYERMAGMVSLYSAFVQSPHPSHPHGISFAWQWLATILNRPPRRITPVILMAFLHIAGYALSNSYRHQFAKLLYFIKSDYLDRLPKDCVGAKTRLQLFIENFEKQRRLPTPDGYLS